MTPRMQTWVLFEVSIRRVCRGRVDVSPKKKGNSGLDKHDDPGFVHECANGAHRTGLGAVQPQPRAERADMIFTFIDEDPYSVFHFYYRSRDFLQAEGIIFQSSKLPSQKNRGMKREHDNDIDSLKVTPHSLQRERL